MAAAAAPKPVPARRHNEVLDAARKRVDQLEARLADVIQPILDRAGTEAAARFEKYATNHLTAAAADVGVTASSTMVCVKPRPEEAQAIADPDGDPAELLHVTVVYVGDTDGDLGLIADALRPVAASLAPLAGVVGGYGVFDPPGVGILLPDVRGLVELRVAVCEALMDAGIEYARNHGFEAHLTVHSAGSGQLVDDTLNRVRGAELHFDSLYVVRGNSEEIEIPLVGVPPLTASSVKPAAGADAGYSPDYTPPPQWTAPFPDEVLNVEALVAEILAKTEPVRLAMVEQTMTPALREAGLAWDVANPLAGEVLAQSASQITHIAETTQLNVMRIVKAAFNNGLTVPQTRDLIREGMRAASKTRATLIARTELVGAANGSSLAATRIVAHATGSNYNKTWRTAPGAKYPRHEDYPDLDGQTVGLEATFDVGGDALMFPGDPNGDPGEVCNCRCVLTYDTPEGEEEADAEEQPDFADAGTLGFS